MLPLQFKFIFDSVCMSWILLLFIYLIGISEQNEFTGDYRNQDEFLRKLSDYEITIPSAVTSEGDHVTFKLHPSHSVRKRSVDGADGSFQDNFIHYKVSVENKELLLQVQPNHNLLSPGAVIERKKNRFNNVSDSTFTRVNDTHRTCHYHGEILNVPDSRVALAVCNGLMGFIHTSDIEYFIEPIRGDNPVSSPVQRHAIYRRSALPSHLDPISIREKRRATSNDASCGVKREERAIRNRERWESRHRQAREDHHRKKRSVSTERYVETLVVVDPKMVEYHDSDHLETYILTIMNMVAKMFHDASIGNSINIVLVRILIMEEHEEELVITHHADKTLQSFCKFQKTINFKDDDHPNHHDVAILLTRQNICSRLNEPCSTLGLAQVSGMCQPHRSCNINEDTGLALAYTVTHELGHNFGMHHDGSKNGCKDPPGKQLYIMSPSLVADSLTKRWSNCSQVSITTFIDRDWGYCLDDEPADHEYKFPVLPPGTMYNADHQCRLQYGTDKTSVCTSSQDVCSNLWCRSENRCSTHLEAAAEGTICGTNKWCYQGECVKIGNRPESINGEWSQWGDWTPCSRTCGAGVSHSQRHCDNPRPSHGGKYCLGERKRFRLCNTKSCPDGSKSFHTVQCEEFNYVPYKKGLYEWEHVPMPDTPCQLHCRPKNQFFSVLLKDIVTDGTPCTSGTRDMCISGRCRHVGCDYVIDSSAKEDRCGVCHGDGSTCTTIKSQFNESQGLGYVEATVIPKWARNISVEEVEAANNFLALQNDKGEYYLNGHWFIQWSGDYEVAGTVVRYQRVGNKESFHAAGPLKEPLHIMLLLQSENPGVIFEYTVPKENISDTRIPEFNWQYQPWTHCTASCGGGTQRMEVVCVEIEAGIVEDIYCNSSSKPDDKQKVCNEHLCPARWWSGPWQHCSVTCGKNGTHQRTVICVRSLGPDEQIALEDDECRGLEKPQEVQPCHKKAPCQGSSPWIPGEWSSCGSNPCGLKYRKVECEDPTIGCYDNPVPVSEMLCSNNTCGRWFTEQWQECTRSCDGGIQVRKVVCEGGIQCDHESEPVSSRECNTDPCPTAPPQTTHPTSPPPTNPSISHSSTQPTPTSTVTSSSDHVTTSQSHVTTNVVPSSTTEEVAADKLVPTVASDPEVPVPTEENSDSLQESKERKLADDIEVDTTFEEEMSSEDTQLTNISSSHVKNEGVDTMTSEGSQENEETFNTVDNSIFEGTTESDGEVAEADKGDNSVENKGDNLEQIEISTEVWDGDKPESEVRETDMNREETDMNREETDMNRESAEVVNDSGLERSTENNSQLGIISDPVTQPVIPTPDTNITPVTDKHHHGYQGKHKHRHHHGDYPDVIEEGETIVERYDNDNRNISTEVNLTLENSNVQTTEETIAVEESQMTHLEPDTSTGRERTTVTDSNDGTPDDVASEIPSTQKAPEAPALPSNVFLPHPKPPLPKNLPPLPDSGKLPPLNTRHLPSLPVQKNLPPLPNNRILPPLPGTEHLPTLPVKDLLPYPDEMPTLPKNQKEMPKLPPLPDINAILTDPGNEAAKPGAEDILRTDVTGPDLQVFQGGTAAIVYKWQTSDWTKCSRVCGRGVRTRSVDCINDITKEDVPKRLCNINSRPTAIDQECNNLPCLDWQTTDWSECSATCGLSVQSRRVYCPVDMSCDPDKKPEATRSCDQGKCVSWVSGQWSQCDKTCGGGKQFRIIQCVNLTSQQSALGCPRADRPSDVRGCNNDACQEIKAAALNIECYYNEMSSVVCRALRKMNQCHRRYVRLKCCKTCEMKAKHLYRPKAYSVR